MIKTVFVVKRQPGITHEEYVENYLEHHAPLTLDHLQGVEKYVVSFVTPSADDPDAPDVIVEIYWRSAEDLGHPTYSSEQGRQLLHDDRDATMGEQRRYVVDEYVLKDGPPAVLYRPGAPVAALDGRVLPGAGWS